MKLRGLSRLMLGAQLLISPMALDAEASCAGLVLRDFGSGVYKVVAQGLNNVGAIDFVLTYDKAALSSPQVVKGDLADWMLFLPNTIEASGTVRVAMVNEPPVSGSGTVATVTFAPIGKSWGKPALTCVLTSLDASNQPIEGPLTNDSGGGLSGNDSDSQDANPQDTVQPDTGPSRNSGQQTVTTQQNQTTQQDNAAGNPSDSDSPLKTASTVQSAAPGAINLGAVGFLDEEQAPVEPPPAVVQEPSALSPVEQPSPAAVEGEEDEYEPHSPPVSSLPSGPVPAAGASERDQKYVVHRGVLERFREYKGERSPKALMALFDEHVAAFASQHPPICLSDGNMTLKVLVELPESGNHAPNFALRGASLKSLKRQGDNRWMIEAAPEPGRVEATLTIVNGEKVVDYSFTISPRVDVNVDRKGAADEVDFSLFLSKVGTDSSPAYDLNGDGRRDYVDDYIYTANYLLAVGGNRARKK